MEAAVRGLERDGVRRDRILVHRARSEGRAVHLAPAAWGWLAVGAGLGALGGILWSAVGFVTVPTPPGPDVALGFGATVLFGAFLGAVIAAIAGAVQRTAAPGYHDYVVEVRGADEVRRDVPRLLEARGGELLA